ncbi:MAG: hypothetical protein HPY83_12635 [Anaerolineae bacterium]|nr:hypothetical protein [Anaerolineae bacterium]
MMPREGQQGQNLAELALVLPLLILLFVGIADLGRAFHAFIVVENAAREAARYGASYPDRLHVEDGTPNAEERAANEVLGSGLAVGTIEYSQPPENPPAGQVYVYVTRSADGATVTARVAYAFPLITGFLGIGPITLTGTADMMVLSG